MRPRYLTRGRRRGLSVVAVGVASLAVAACGSSSSSGSGASATSANSSTASGATTAASGATSTGAASGASTGGSSAAAPASWISYTGGKAGSANMSLKPVEIGFVNDQGGSTVIAGTDPTTGAQAGVRWVNKYAGGIDGHPLKLVTCFVKNAEAEGQTCAQQFLANKNISIISYGAMALGATSIDSTVAGKKPIVAGVSINPPDITTKNLFTLFGANPYLDYPQGELAKTALHAKTAALLYPNQTGQQLVMAAVQKSMESEGIKVKLVGFDPNSSDLTGALEAAGATSADVVDSNAATPSQCVAFEKAAHTLGIPDTKIIGLFQCQIPSIKAQYPGGDYPQWLYTTGSPAPYESTTIGKQYKSVFGALGISADELDPWTLVEYSDILTIAKWMNAVGADKITPAALTAQAKAFKGPVLLGPAKLACGKYPKAPAVCADGLTALRYSGGGKYSVIGYIETPAALQKELGATTITR
jgi:branched-chain amino acid transport system substrate-binding protein